MGLEPAIYRLQTRAFYKLSYPTHYRFFAQKCTRRVCLKVNSITRTELCD